MLSRLFKKYRRRYESPAVMDDEAALADIARNAVKWVCRSVDGEPCTERTALIRVNRLYHLINDQMNNQLNKETE